MSLANIHHAPICTPLLWAAFKLLLWGWHRDKTRVQMAEKMLMFPHLKLFCWLFMGTTFGFDTKQRNSFLVKFGVFLQ
jgi:hypothetical protein